MCSSDLRGIGYVPTFSEMRSLRATLKSFKTEDREQLYKPLKRWFEDYGFKFDDSGDLVLAKNAAQFDYVQPSKVLENDRSAFRNAPLNYNQKVAAQEARKRKAMIDTERARRAALTPAQRRREDLTLANRIEADRRKGMSYEQRRALEALDLARWDELPEATLPWEEVVEAARRQGISEAEVIWDLAGRRGLARH